MELYRMASLLLLIMGCFQILPIAGQEFSFASYYGSSMVLQRAPAGAVLWGYGVAQGDVVDGTLSLDGTAVQTFTTNVITEDNVLIWRVTLDPVQAGGPYEITVVSNTASVTLTDVMFGDVWFCSGQSNMAHTINNIDNPQPDIDDAVNYPNVRTFYAELVFSDVPLKDLGAVKQNWTRPDTSLLPSFSAVCWFFGRNLNNATQVPIGLIETCWGGTRIEAWSSPAVLQACYGSEIPPGSDQNAPSALYNAMIYPFLPMPVFGGTWYQGESNAGNAASYACLLKSMVEDYRASWLASTGGQTDPDFPFGVVQLANTQFNDLVSGYEDVRWAQSGLTGYLPNADWIKFFMAVAMDLPDENSPTGSIHPRYKRQVSDRLSLAARAVAYGEDVGRFQGPVPTAYLRVASGERDTVEITFDDGTVELVESNKFAFGFEACCAQESNYTCTNDWSMAPTLAVETGKVTIAVLCNSPPPFVTGVRYAWRRTPVVTLLQAHLYSVENNLPVPPFIYYGSIPSAKKDNEL